MNKLLSIVIPVYNEADTLQKLYKQILETYKNKLTIYKLEIIFIDDGSRDKSLEILKSLYLQDPRIIIVSLRKTLGKSAALMQGFRRAKGDIIMTMDADLQDDPSNIPGLLDRLIQDKCDLVVGWRKNRQDPFSKIVISTVFNVTVRFISGIKLHDFNSGLKVFKKDVLNEMQLYGELYRFIPILAAQRGFRVSEIPVIHHKRESGESKYGWGRIFKGFFDFLTVIYLGNFGQSPLQLFGMFGFISLSLGVIFGIYLTILHFQGESIGKRPLLILAVLLILTGLQLFATGFLAELIVNKSSHDESLPVDYETKSAKRG